MIKPTLQCPGHIFLFLFFISGIIELPAQCFQPDQSPTVQCADAPLICLQDACFSTTDQSDSGWNGFCGSNTSINNPQYFEVIPTEECITIHIHVDDCNGGFQLQAALVTSCNWLPCPGSNVPCSDVLDCDPGTPVGGTMVIDACGLTPGVSLWLLIDGSSGANCQYTITFAEGIQQPAINEDITTGEASPAIFCQGYQDVGLTAGPGVTNAHGYLWELEWSNEIIYSDEPETMIDIASDAPVGIWDICVSAFSGCDTTDNPFCFTIEITSSTITTEASLCCGGTVCGLCTDLELNFTGEGPWSVVISDGSSLDTIEGIETTPYLHQVCRDFPAFVEYSIAEILTPDNDCSTAITSGDVAIHFFEPGLPQDWPWIFQIDSNILCALPDYLAYSWHTCDDTTVIATTECIEVEADGCYCIEILFIDSCAYTWCSDIILSAENVTASEIKILPNPSNGRINIQVNETEALPIAWKLIDPNGREIRKGELTASDTELNLSDDVVSGLYFMVLENAGFRDVRKIVISK